MWNKCKLQHRLILGRNWMEQIYVWICTKLTWYKNVSSNNYLQALYKMYIKCIQFTFNNLKILSSLDKRLEKIFNWNYLQNLCQFHTITNFLNLSGAKATFFLICGSYYYFLKKKHNLFSFKKQVNSLQRL